MKCYNLLKSYTVWASSHLLISRTIIVIMSIGIMASGYFIGLDMYYHDYYLPLYLPVLILAANVGVVLFFSKNPFKRNGQRKSAKHFYFDRITRYSATVYAAFLIMICFGNIDYDTERTKPQDLYANWWEYSTSSNLEASIVYNVPPPVEKKVVKKKRMKRKGFRKAKGKTVKASKLTENRKRMYLAAGIANIILSILCVAGACTGICVGLLTGVSSALFLGLWSLVSLVVCIVLMIVGWKKFRRA